MISKKTKERIVKNPSLMAKVFVDVPHNPEGFGYKKQGVHGKFTKKPYKREPMVYVVLLAIVSISMSIGIIIGRFL